MPKPPLRHYSFTWEEVMSALQRRMHDADHADGISLLTNADHTASKKPLFHRCRASDAGITIDLFEEMPMPDPEPLLLFSPRGAVLERKTVPLSKDPAGGA